MIAKKFIAVFLTVVMACFFFSCGEEAPVPLNAVASDNAETVFEVPDFSQNPIAAGDTVITTVSAMLASVKAFVPAKFSLAQELHDAPQTVHTKEDLSDAGTPLEDPIPVLDAIPAYTSLFDVSPFKQMTEADFEPTRDGTMYHLKKERLPKAFASYAVTNYAMDMTAKTVILRGVTQISEGDVHATVYMTLTIRFDGGNTYHTSFLTQEYGESDESEYVLQSGETFTYTTENGEIVSGEYTCTQDTVTRTSSMKEDPEHGYYFEAEYAAEKVLITTDIAMVNGCYKAKRKVTLSQIEGSYNPDDAKTQYEADQTISFTNGHYLLKETASGYNDKGESITGTQYIVYT